MQTRVPVVSRLYADAQWLGGLVPDLMYGPAGFL
jgi:hypothetical protein